MAEQSGAFRGNHTSCSVNDCRFMVLLSGSEQHCTGVESTAGYAGGSRGQGMFPNTWICLSPSPAPPHKCASRQFDRAEQPHTAGESRTNTAAPLPSIPLLPPTFMQGRVRHHHPPPLLCLELAQEQLGSQASASAEQPFWSILSPRQRQQQQLFSWSSSIKTVIKELRGKVRM